MAPKKGTKRKETAESSSATQDAQEAYFQQQARLDALHELKLRPVVVERGVKKEGTFGAYIEAQKWNTLAKAKDALHRGKRSVYYEFFLELTLQPTVVNRVPVRGIVVDISAKAINAALKLPDIPNDQYTQFLQAPLNVAAITQALTGRERQLHPDWKFLEKKWLTPEAKLLNTFVSSWLMPVVMNSQVLRKRALLIYALSQGMTVDVGRVINAEIHAAVDQPRRGQSIGFPALITSLCYKAGIFEDPQDTSDLFLWKGDLKLKDFHPDDGAGPRRSASPPPSTEHERSEGQPSSSGASMATEQRQDYLQLEARMDARFGAMESKIDAFFAYQIAVNQYMMSGQQGPPPTFPLQSPQQPQPSTEPPPSPPQP